MFGDCPSALVRMSAIRFMPMALTYKGRISNDGARRGESGIAGIRCYYVRLGWPCAIKTTQRLLEAKDRSMGNSVLQAGTSIGAIITPLVLSAMLTPALNSWRLPFQAIGAIGIVWIVFWFLLVRKDDLTPRRPPVPMQPGSGGLAKILFSRRMLVLFFIVACINTSWQTFRAWMPKFLQQGRGYAEADALHFNSLFFVATDVGCLGAWERALSRSG